MKMPNLIPLTLALALGACQGEPEPSEAQKSGALTALASAAIVDRDDNEVGKAVLNKTDGKVTIELELSQFESGTKAFHLHSVGRCDAPDFKSADGHLNPDGKSHGRLSADGQHLGDLPNLEIPDDGNVKIQIDIAGRADAVVASIDDQDGTAVMIHAGPDDYVSDPAGAAGPRIACGVLEFVAQPEV